MKSVLLISFSEASGPKSKEVHYRAVGEEENANPQADVFFPPEETAKLIKRKKSGNAF